MITNEQLAPACAASPTPNHRLRAVVVAPTYNNACTIVKVLEAVEAIDLAIVVVNDGSTDDTAERLAAWTAGQRAVPVTLIEHEHNRGKAAALRTGFDAARKAGYTHAVSIDTDGQLDAAQIPALLDTARQYPDALVIGKRDEQVAGCPGSNRLGHFMSALGIWLETGRHVSDSQCGLRVYPLHALDTIRCRAGRFGFEAEVITRAAWAGCTLKEVPVTCRYFPEEERISHFKPWRDGCRGFFMHAYLTLRRLAPWPHRKIESAGPSGRGAARPSLVEWVSPATLLRQLRESRFRQLVISAGIGIGTFFSVLPLGGWQIPLAMYAAYRLRVHLLPVLAGLLWMLPPCGDWLAKAAIVIGHTVLHLSPPDLAHLNLRAADHWSVFARVPFAWPLGAIVVAFLGNWIMIAVFVRVLRLIPVRNGLDDSQEVR